MMMQSNKKLAKASFVYFFGNIFDKAVAFITIPIFTRLLSTSDYGIATTYISWVGIVTVIITLSLGNSIRTAIVDYPDKIEEYISSIFFLGTLSSLFVSILVISVFYCIGSDIPFFLVPLCCIHAYSASIISAIQIKYMMEIKYIRRTLLMSIPNIIVVVLSIFLIKSRQSDFYLGKIYAYVIVTSLFGLFYVFYYSIKGRSFINLNYWKYSLTFSLPLIFHALSNVVLSQSDRSMITFMSGPSETGLYSLAYQFGLVPLVFCTTLENVWIPWFTEKMQRRDYLIINKTARPYIFIISILCVLIMLIAPEVLKLLSTPEYFNAVYMVPPIVMATFFMFLASVSLDLEYYLKKTRTIATNTLIAAIVNILLNLYFIPKYGGYAAAYTTAVSYFLSFALHWIYTHNVLEILFPLKIYILPLIIVIISSVSINYIIDFIYIRWFVAFLIIVFFSIHILFNKENVLKTIKKK